MQVIPKDHMSTFPSYWPSSMAKITSGAILRKQSHCKICHYMSHVSGIKCNVIMRDIFKINLFFCIPIWSPNKGVGRTGNGGRAKICEFYLPWLRQQNVSCLDISVKTHNRKGLQHHTDRTHKHLMTCLPPMLKHPPVNHLVGMKVSQSLKSTMGNCSYFHLLQRLLVNWRGHIHPQGCQSRMR